MPRAILTSEVDAQTAFNVTRWEELISDPALARRAERVETDAAGNLIMSPPAAPQHSDYQGDICFLLRTLLPNGRALPECAISTPKGVRAADVAWLSAERIAEIKAAPCLLRAPEICVEVISPRNTVRELREKQELFFAAGAIEVWFCRADGAMEFHTSDSAQPAPQSAICPGFPKKVGP